MQKIAIFIILIYRKLKDGLNLIIHPLFGVVFTCKHKPSCSDYTVIQVNERGTIRGLFSGFKRIIKCW